MAEQGPFLEVLEAMILRDGALPGFEGTLCVGLRNDDGNTRWLQVDLGARAQTQIVSNLAPSSTAAVLLGQAEATALLAQRALPEGRPFIHWYGDRTFIETFLERYLSRKRAFALRTQR